MAVITKLIFVMDLAAEKNMLKWLPPIDENTPGKPRRSELIVFRGGVMCLTNT
jgi:hypothetical protein